MDNIGQSLKERRMEKGLTIAEIANETRIRKRYLEAMENEEWDIIPGRVYLKGFLRTYCRRLDLDEASFLDALDNTFKPTPVQDKIPEKIELPGRPKKKIGLIFSIVALFLLLATQYVYKTYFVSPPSIEGNQSAVTENNEDDNKVDEGGTNTNSENNSTNDSSDTSQTHEVIPIVQDISLRIEAIDGRCWISVKNGNKLLFDGTLVKGEVKEFSSLKEVYFTLGNAGGVKVILNGTELEPLGAVGEVIYKKYKIIDNEIQEIKL